MWRLILLTGCLVVSATPAPAAPMTSPFRAANWSGGALNNEQTKAFDRCVATTQDPKGNVITYSVNHQYQWGVALSNPTWNFVKGASLNLVLKIGQSADLLGATALATDKSVLEIQVKDTILLFSKLRGAREFRVAVGGLILELPLGAGDEALSALTQCAMRATRFRQNAKSKNSIFDSHDSTDPEIQEEAKTLVANIIAYAASREAQILPKVDDFAEVPVDAAWKAGLVTVGVTIVDTHDAIQDVQDALVERGVRSCRGGFFFMPLPGTIDQAPIARVFTTCQTPEAVMTLYHLVIERPKGGFYVLSMRTTGSGFGGVAQKAVDEYEDRIRAVLMISIKKLEGG
jgi:hypothetical protein